MSQIESLINFLGSCLARVLFYPPIIEYQFLQHALVGLVILAPLCAMIGIQVVNFRLAFFSEAVGHSIFTGIALGSVLVVLGGVQEDKSKELVVQLSMMGFGVIVAILVTAYRRRTSLPSDTIIGIFSAAIVALGLAVITFLMNTAQGPSASIFQTLLAGNILTIEPAELAGLLLFFVVAMSIEIFAYNRLMLIGLNPELAETRGINVAFYEYMFGVLLALVVMFSVQWVGVLLVTAFLVIPAATARNLAMSAGGVFWLATSASLLCAVGGLILSDLFSTTTGATVILCMTAVFVVSTLYAHLIGR